jgi:uncharacterized lipoprotein YmbA
MHSPNCCTRTASGARSVALLLGIAVLLAGCVSLLEPRQSDIRYYVLGAPETLATIEASSDTIGLSVGFRRVRMADYLDALSLVTRRGPHAVQFAEFHRWGEELPNALNRIVAARLLAQEGVGAVDVVPFSSSGQRDYLIQLQVLRFEGEGPPLPPPDEDPPETPPMGSAQMTIAWEIVQPETEAVVSRDVTRHRVDGWRVNDYANLVAKLDTSVTVLAEDLAARLRQVNRSMR